MVTQDKIYQNEDCHWSFCTACIFEKTKIFYFRGFCEDEVRLDTQYIILKSSIQNDDFKFSGLEGLTAITYNKTESNWQLVYIETNEVLGYLTKKIDDGSQGVLKKFPFGVREWSMIERCNIKLDNYANMTFLFSRVGIKIFKQILV